MMVRNVRLCSHFNLDQMLVVIVDLVAVKVADVLQRNQITLESLIARLNVVVAFWNQQELVKPDNTFISFYFLSISIIILPSFVKFINGSSDDVLFLFI